MKEQSIANALFTEFENLKNLREELILLNAPQQALAFASSALRSAFEAYLSVSHIKEEE